MLSKERGLGRGGEGACNRGSNMLACLLSTSVRATLRMRAIYKNQFLPWQRQRNEATHKKQKKKEETEREEKSSKRRSKHSGSYSDGKQTNKPETNSVRNK